MTEPGGRRRDRAAGPRPMVRATAGLEASEKASLALVPRRRRAARFAVLLCTMIGLVMLSAAAFQTQLAQRQLEMDRIDSAIGTAREHYDELRRERSELRSPSRLAQIADEQGMVAATTNDFATIDPLILAEAEESIGVLEDASTPVDDSPLRQFSDVKAVTGGAP